MLDDRSFRLLFVEDLQADMELAVRALRKAGLRFESARVDTEPALLESMRVFRPDIIVSDYSMPSFDGMSALRAARESNPIIPFIILTGAMNEEVAVGCMKAGANDYVLKEHLDRLAFSIREALDKRSLLALNAAQEGYLRLSEERYRSLFSNSKAVMLIIDPADLSIVEANQAAVDFYGWPMDALLRMRMPEINTLGKAVLGEQVRRAVAMEKSNFQFKHRLADGTLRDVETHSSPIKLGNDTFLFSIIHDITDREEAKRERDAISQRLDHYLLMSPTITYSLRFEGGVARMEWISENVEALLGYTAGEAVQPEWWFSNVFQADRAKALGGIPVLIEKKSHAHEYRFMRKDRSIVWVRDEMRLIGGRGDDDEIVGTLTDVTEKMRANERIEASLREKEIMLREIHHRVKNNMQVISSLLSLTASNASDPTVHEVIGELQRRIEAMAIVHEQFYKAGDLSRIDFGLYITQLGSSLSEQACYPSGDTVLAYDVVSLLLGLEEAIPAGLAVSEILAVALRRPAENPAERLTGPKPIVQVALRESDNGRVTVEVRDERADPPAWFTANDEDSLGMQLISILAEQLEGSVRFGNGSVALDFPVKRERKKG